MRRIAVDVDHGGKHTKCEFFVEGDTPLSPGQQHALASSLVSSEERRRRFPFPVVAFAVREFEVSHRTYSVVERGIHPGGVSGARPYGPKAV